jgi:hypothetical protein
MRDGRPTPWVLKLFSAPVLARFGAKQQQKVVDVPYFDGLPAGDTGAMVESFAGERRLHHPLRGRIEGEQEFREFVADTDRWAQVNGAAVEDVQRIVLAERGFEEVVVHLETPDGRIDFPTRWSPNTPRWTDQKIRIYFSTHPLTGHPTERAPLLRADPKFHRGPVGECVGARAARDAAAVAAAFGPDGRAREPDRAGLVHSGADLPAFYAAQRDERGSSSNRATWSRTATLRPRVQLSPRPPVPHPRAPASPSWSVAAAAKLAAARIYAEP